MKMITTAGKITEHFAGSEFACKGSCTCGKINIDEQFVQRMEKLYTILSKLSCGVSAIYITSGYRCAKACTAIAGAFIGDMHNIGAAADFYAVDAKNNGIDSMTLCEAAQIAGFGGIAVISNFAAHVDDRQRGDITYTNKQWYGNESTGDNYMTFRGKSKYASEFALIEKGQTVNKPKQIKVDIWIDDHKYSGLLDD